MQQGWYVRLIAVVLMATACVSAEPTSGPATRPGFVNVLAFMDGYRISHYQDLAVKLQRVEPNQRARMLMEIAKEPEHASEVFVLCRMLFEGYNGEPFRGPMIGSALFLDVGSAYSDWPLDPIAIQDGVPILIVGSYAASGEVESPVRYLNSCLANLKWTRTKYAPFDQAQAKKAVKALIAAHPGLSDSVDVLRKQAQ